MPISRPASLSSECNISLVVARGDADEAVRKIHEAFKLHESNGV